MKSYRKVLLLVIAINFLIALSCSIKVNEMKEASSNSDKSNRNTKKAKGGPETDDAFKAANNLNEKRNPALDNSLSKSFDNMKEEEKSLVNCLFEKEEKNNCDCEGDVSITARVKGQTTSTILYGNIKIVIPIPKKSPFKGGDIEFGFGLSAFLFDYLDSIFQFDIVYEFLQVYWEIFNFKYENESDPYWIEYLTGRQTIYKGVIEKKNVIKIDFKVELDKQVTFSIPNQGIYDISVTLPQLEKFFVEWNWEFEGKTGAESARNFLNFYDLNGDGRLSPRELLLGLILENVENDLCTFCLKDIKLKFDVMFKYMKCFKENHLLIIQMVKKLKLLKRQSKLEYNIYGCPKESYITQIVSDFFTKTYRVDHESLNVYEQTKIDNVHFRLGLLLGFWNRQVSDEYIYGSEGILSRFEKEKNIKIENRGGFSQELDGRTVKIERWGPTKNILKDCPPPSLTVPEKNCYD
jgi:hypothetical protein